MPLAVDFAAAPAGELGEPPPRFPVNVVRIDLPVAEAAIKPLPNLGHRYLLVGNSPAA